MEPRSEINLKIYSNETGAFTHRSVGGEELDVHTTIATAFRLMTNAKPVLLALSNDGSCTERDGN